MDVRHGASVRDPYRWLEDGAADEVRLWSAAQGRHTRATLDAIPFAARIRERLRALFSIGLVSAPAIHGSRYFHQRRTGDQEQPVLYVRDGREGPDSVLIDPAALAEDRTSALDWYYPSDDGRLVAYGVSEGGSEKSVLRVRDVDAGRDLADVIPNARACSLEWRPDGSGFFYTRYPEPGTVPEGEENYHRRVYEHVLGRDWREDPLVFGGDRPPEDWPNVHLSPDGRWLAVSVSRGWTRTDVYLRDLTAAGTGLTTVIEGVDAIFGVEVRNDRLYMLTNLDAPRSRLVAADLQRPGRESWHDVLPQTEDVLEGAALIGEWIVAVWLRDASSRVTIPCDRRRADPRRRAARHRQRGRPHRPVGWPRGVPGFHVVCGAADRLSPRPSRAGALALGTRGRRRRPRSLSRASRPLPLAGRDAHLHVPRRGQGPPHRRPGRGPPHRLRRVQREPHPAFGRGVLLFLERGGLYAVAHLRGGGEYGEDWHRQGMLDRKQNVFDDFTAAGEFLVREGHVAPDRLAIMGGSNGGLLVGAALTQRPDLFRAVVCQVPLLDMVRYHLLPDRPSLDPGVRIPRRPGGVPVAARLLALPSRARRRALPRRAADDGGVGQPRRPAARAQDGGAPAGGHLVRAPDPPARRDARRPRAGQAPLEGARGMGGRLDVRVFPGRPGGLSQTRGGRPMH